MITTTKNKALISGYLRLKKLNIWVEIITYAVFLHTVLQAYTDLAEDQTSKSNVTVKPNAAQ